MSESGAGDPLDTQAEKLVPSCKIWAISSFTKVIDHFEFLQTCKPNDWDFFATVASVTAAMQLLANEVPRERFNRLNGIVQTHLTAWDAQAPSATMDCLRFVNRTMESIDQPDGKLQLAFGLWVLWNLLQRQPTKEEFNAANPIGTLLAEPLLDWWR
jgi:hypothetical protein